jgi:crossover junction endodeoxyribonuclease RuvC
MPYILGIDPGLQITGYGIVDLADGAIEPTLVEAGLFKLDRTQALEQRLGQLHEDLSQLLDEHRPRCMAVEELYVHYRHPRTAILMAHARGVVLLCAQEHGVEVEHMPSTEVKKAVTGYGHASKEQVQLAVQSQCRLERPPSPPDVADAIAIALTLARRRALTRL